jgi:hypothetical protein
MDHRLLVLAVSKQASFLDAVAAALADLADPAHPAYPAPAYAEALRRARRYLDRALPDTKVELVTAGSVRRAADARSARRSRWCWSTCQGST